MKRRSSQLIEACDTSETCESGKTTDESLTDVDSKKAYRSESFFEIEDEAKMLNPPFQIGNVSLYTVEKDYSYLSMWMTPN